MSDYDPINDLLDDDAYWESLLADDEAEDGGDE